MIRLGSGRLDRVVAVGAHCDDIAIGAGGTLLTMCRARPGIRVDALVLSGGGGGPGGARRGRGRPPTPRGAPARRRRTTTA
ncbi:hypothetical protein ACFQ71_11820, partial [Streptomyces sp. NPDC056534]